MSKILLNTGPSERGWHRLEAWLRCPQLFAYAYLIKPEGGLGDRGPLVRGTIGHAGLAHHFARLRAKQRGDDPNAYHTIEDAMALVAAMHGELGEFFLPIALRAVMAYITQFVYEDFEVVAVEEAVRAYVKWPDALVKVQPSRANEKFLITQRFDRVFKDKGKRVWIEDHKFVAKIQGKTVTRYILSGQFHLMQWFGRALYGDAFGGARINLLECQENPDVKPKSLQLPCEPAPNALGRFARNVCDAEEGIARLAAEGRDPWDYPAAMNEQVCLTPYGACPAFELCRWGKAGL